tara:strand:+ start:710 stop:997 length:288 start_codon:yes stop_codon:yes gene_type:complete
MTIFKALPDTIDVSFDSKEIRQLKFSLIDGKYYVVCQLKNQTKLIHYLAIAPNMHKAFAKKIRTKGFIRPNLKQGNQSVWRRRVRNNKVGLANYA